MNKLSKYLVIILGFILMICPACKKEDKTVDVSYSVVVDGNTPGYTVKYTGENGTTISKGITGNSQWTSGSLKGFKRGSSIYFSLESNAGSYHMYIYINGVFYKHRDAGGGGVQSMEETIPN